MLKYKLKLKMQSCGNKLHVCKGCCCFTSNISAILVKVDMTQEVSSKIQEVCVTKKEKYSQKTRSKNHVREGHIYY